MGNLMMQQIIAGAMCTNCYLVYDETTRETIIVDPGDEADKIARIIEQQELKPVLLLLTHGHFDHVGAVNELKKRYGIEVSCHVEEQSVLESPDLNLSGIFGKAIALKAGKTFCDGEKLSYLGRTIRVIHTPGHTKGSCCFYFEEDQFLISGDTLFAESVGRTDFPTGSTSTLVHSIENKLFVLPDETPVYPGHNEATTIGHEKKYNPCVRG